MPAELVNLIVDVVRPVHIEQRGSTCFADFGKAAYGNLEIHFLGDAPATLISVRLGEKLGQDGTIDRKPPGSVIFKEVKLQLVPGERVYRLSLPSVKRHSDPSAVHMPSEIGEVTPFRYVEIEDSPLPLDGSSLRQLFVHAPFNDDSGRFECSDGTLNAVWNLCHHTMKATTAFGVYIDGERERIAYEGDAYINLLSHYACDLDPRVARYTFEHLLKWPTWPVEWSLHMPMLAAADFEATGDPILAREHFDALKKKLLMDNAREDGLLRAEAIVDWPVGERDGFNDGVISTRDSRTIGPEVNSVVNAFYGHNLLLMAMLAQATKRHEEAQRFTELATQVAESFHKAFFDARRGIYIDGEGSTHASLHANMFPLAFGLVPAEHRKSVADFVVSRGMACSVYGAQYLLEGLFLAGRENHAIELMSARTERSWWHMIELGSTMTLEAWDARFKPNLTWNHAWGAVPANILTRYVLGVRPLSPGYQSILIAPQFGPLQWTRGAVPTPYGLVHVELQNANRFQLTVNIPKGTTARVILPRSVASAVKFNRALSPNQPSSREYVFDSVPAGTHVFDAQ